MSKNSNLTHLDPSQISTIEHDATFDAKRVILVGGEIDSDKIAAAVKEGLKDIRIETKQESMPQVYQPVEIQTIEKNIFIPQIEIREIEKQVIVPQIEYRTVEIPVIIKETEVKIIEVEKERHYPLIMQICAVVQAICVIGLLFYNLMRK